MQILSLLTYLQELNDQGELFAIVLQGAFDVYLGVRTKRLEKVQASVLLSQAVNWANAKR